MRISVKKIIALVALVLALTFIVFFMLNNYVYVARNVTVEGDVDMPADEVIRASRLPLGAKLKDIDESLIRMSLESTGIMKLDRLEIQKPNSIILHVSRRARDVIVLNAGMILILDMDGYVVERFSEVPDNDAIYVSGLVITSYAIGKRVSAPEASLTAMRLAVDAIKRLGARGLVSELNVENVEKLYIYTRTGIKVELGNSSKMDDKILWMASAVRDLESRGESGGKLDVSGGDKADYMPN